MLPLGLSLGLSLGLALGLPLVLPLGLPLGLALGLRTGATTGAGTGPSTGVPVARKEQHKNPAWPQRRSRFWWKPLDLEQLCNLFFLPAGLEADHETRTGNRRDGYTQKNMGLAPISNIL